MGSKTQAGGGACFIHGIPTPQIAAVNSMRMANGMIVPGGTKNGDRPWSRTTRSLEREAIHKEIQIFLTPILEGVLAATILLHPTVAMIKANAHLILIK